LFISSDRTTGEAELRPRVWRCANHYIYPSLYQMINIKDGNTISMSKLESRFIDLLLQSKEIVERDETRLKVFDIDPSDPQSDPKNNEMNRLVVIFRRILGRRSIKVVSRVGHIMMARRYICVGKEREFALSRIYDQ